MDVIYRHRQVGTVMLVAFGTVAAVSLVGVVLQWGGLAWVAILVGGVAAAIVFGTLTVEVADGRLMLWFGPGLIRRTFPLVQIQSVRPVRNRWYYGWGIRLVPGGWLFNVSGLNAVEITLASGRRYRIGTDEPQALNQAIERALAAH